jgi:hypothetical protein
MILLPTGALLAADSDSASEATQTTGGTAATAGDGSQAQCCCCGNDPIQEFAGRVGAWSVKATGSPVKVGEYQSLSSSPFWDLDGLYTDGCRTVDFSATGTDDDDTQDHIYFYAGPQFAANIFYEDFPHQLENTNYYPGFTTVNGATKSPAATANYYSRTDMSPGTDYAINVQEFKANLKGDLTTDGMFKWRVNVFGIEKEGNQQVNTVTHCDSLTYSGPPPTPSNFSANQCHVTSQAQHIDWKTTEVEPAIEAHLAPWLTVEYSNMMRQFTQDDQDVENLYRNTAYGVPPVSPTWTLGFPGGTAGASVVPDSLTDDNRLKVHAQIGDDTDVYVLSYVGDQEDQLNDTNRHFGGADARITNNSIEGVTLTGYSKVYSENTQIPTESLNTLYPSMASFYQDPQSYLQSLVTQPISRDETSTGFTARWRPFSDEGRIGYGGLAFTGGYEYGQIRRTYADYDISITTPATLWPQPDTDTNMYTVGVEEKWTLQFSSYLRYKLIDTAYPLYGVTPNVSTTLDAALNTSLPTEENRVELGGTWTPSERFMLNGTFYVEDSSNHGPYADFDSTSYPFMFSAMYAVTEKWSINGGYANFVNAINQNVNLGLTATVGSNSYTAPWRYVGNSNVFNIGTNYAFSKRLKLNGSFEYVRGLDVITSTPTPPGAISYAGLGGYSTVSTDTMQVSAGLDYLLTPRVTTFFRYNYYDYGDLATGIMSGKVNMFLVGASAFF